MGHGRRPGSPRERGRPRAQPRVARGSALQRTCVALESAFRRLRRSGNAARRAVLMELTWTTLVFLCLGAAVVWFWQNSLAARETANAAALEACGRLGLQF